MNDETTKVKKTKPSAKRNSEARREQNRLASRNYREKRKQKLALLNEILEPGEVPDIPNVTDNADINAIPGPSGSNDVYLQGQPLSNSPSADPLMSMNIDQGFNNFDNTQSYLTPQTWGDTSQATIPTAFSQAAFPNPLPFTHLSDPFSLAHSDPWGHETFGPSMQFPGDSSAMEYVSPRLVEEIFEDSPESGHSGSQTSSSDSDSALNNVLNGVENLTIEQKRSLLSRLQEDTQGSTSPNVSPPSHQTLPPTPGQLQAINFAKALYKTAHARPTLLPTVYTMEPGLFGAIFANCYALGMGGVDEILVDEGCSVFSLTQDLGYDPSQLPLVKSRFRALSPDLQPIDKQLTFGHHPYIDVIPFKTFRENLMAALEHDPPLIDEGILCHDILAGGFTCWGAGQNPHGMGAGVPWDVRSWEPSVWFLIKYRQLAGDWNGELWKSARSWHSVRGERIQTAQAIEIVDRSYEGTARR
ncbi:hypothetical protein FSARC_4406 [Fusarium sarcochroum]|uniref:BZIP domain-containing protein n=1 Tax=Fusarium sarcochroum TaxID=1208366 RepID=A0A8H4XBI1_9HYPO|nr:hypothetical protein FSARC_4406 [Fusarium sarcochroum]